ncbi:MAG: hypothetical protein ACJ8LI_09470, partial [Chthoniobacterales bacterium]
TRSAADVSLRRLAYYSLSPMLKSAFEQIYGAPFLERMLFAEIGDSPANDLIMRIEYDGAIATNGGNNSDARQDFGVLSGTSESAGLMESFLKQEHDATASLNTALRTAVSAWTVGNMALGENGARELPDRPAIEAERAKQNGIEAALLERNVRAAIRYRVLTRDEINAALAA